MKMDPNQYVNRLSEKMIRMVEDDDFFDVTPEDVRSLLLRSGRFFPREEIIRLRIKYDPWINDREKRFMAELGLDYYNHEITQTNRFYNNDYLVNGYSETQWRMLTQEGYFPGRMSVTHFINLCRENNDVDALEVLELKYGHIYEETNRQILLSHGLPADTPYETLTRTEIDGISFFLWKLTNDDEFVPKSKSVLVSCIRRLRNNGNATLAEQLEDKYIDFLYPDRITQEELAAAEDYFNNLFQ